MRIPITKCFELHALDILCRHSGVRIFARARNPRTTRQILALWIPGLRQTAHPGMRGEKSAAFHPGYACSIFC